MADKDLEIKVRTTADTTGIKQTEAALSDLQKRAAQIGPGAALAERDAAAKAAVLPPGALPGEDIARHIESSFARFAIHAAGIGLIAGIFEDLKKVTAEFEKLSKELEKQGALLTEHGQKYAEEVQSVTKEADVIKIATTAVNDMRSAHERVASVQSEELTLWNQITDQLGHNIASFGKWGGVAEEAGRLHKQLLDAQIEGAERLEAIARQNLVGAIRSGEVYREQFEKLRGEPIDEAIGKTVEHINDLSTTLRGIDYTKFPESWLSTAKNIESAKNQLNDLIKLQKQAQAAADAAAKPLAKALGETTPQFEEQQQREEADHERKRAALEQKRREAVATGDTERAAAIEEEFKHDQFSRDQRKEALQRYVANQESLFRYGAEEPGADVLKDIGTLGRDKYNAAKRELEQIYGAQKAEGPAAKGAAGDTETHRLLQTLVNLWQ